MPYMVKIQTIKGIIRTYKNKKNPLSKPRGFFI